MKKDTTTTTRKATAEQIAQAKADNAIYRTATARTYNKAAAPQTAGKDTAGKDTAGKDTETGATAFITLLRTYETAYNDYENNLTTETAKAYETALIDLANAVTYSVLKKCINVSYNKTLEKTRRELTRDKKERAELDHVARIATAKHFNSKGDTEFVVVDKSADNRYTELIGLTFGNGFDLLHTAVIEIQTQTAQAVKRYCGKLPDKWIETPYTTRKLNRKVWIKSTDNIGGWIDTETTPITEIYKAVRRAIENNRTVNADPRNSYIYISELTTDTETGETDTAYIRYPKFADIGGYVTDFNGNRTTYTADETTATDIFNIIDNMNLTARETKILQLRLSGYGYKAIATYMGISTDNVKRCVRRIREKAEKIGLTANAMQTTETE